MSSAKGSLIAIAPCGGPSMMKATMVGLMLLCGFHWSQAQDIQQKLPEKTRILFLLDGSGSMLGKWGRTTKIDAAKSLIGELVDSLRTDKNLTLAMRVYGHLYPKIQQNCKDTRLEVPFSPTSHDAIIDKLNSIKPKGTTPIAYSLEQAARDFPQEDDDYRHILLIITDGVESCEGNPCAVSLALQRRKVFLRPFIIGLGTLQDEKEFDCIGEYYDAQDRKGFKKALQQSIYRSLAPTTVSVELLDGAKRPRVSNVSLSFVDRFTQRAAYDFVHYRDAQGRPDSVTIDAVPSYDLIVNTLPPIRREKIPLTPGRHNIIKVAAPQGSLKINISGLGPNAQHPKALIRKAGKKDILHIQQLPKEEKYLTGSYDVEVLTLPSTVFKNIKIIENKSKSILVPTPGLLNVNMLSPGYGSIFELRPGSPERWVCNLGTKTSKERINLQPGRYKIVFRARKAPGSKYTSIKTIDIKPGSSTSINLFN